MNVMFKYNLESGTDDCLFDPNLLDQMCKGLDEITGSHLSYDILGLPEWYEINDDVHQDKCYNQESPDVQSRFPEQLRMILDKVQYRSAISWQDDGKSFIIHDQATFENEIMPSYFKTSRWKSFQKQLNIYGFKRVLEKRRKYYHQNFIRSNPSLTSLMKRERVWPKSKSM